PGGMGTGRQLRNQQLILRESLEDRHVGWRIGHIDTVGEYAHSWAARSERSTMCGHVDAECATRDYGHALLHKISAKICCNAVPVRRGCPRAHDRDRALHQVSQLSRTAQPQAQ